MKPDPLLPVQFAGLLLFVALVIGSACSTVSAPQNASADTATSTEPSENTTVPTPELDPSLLDRLKTEKWTGDLGGLLERRYIRALVLYNKTDFFYDGPQERGATYEGLKEFEKFLNSKLRTGDKPINMVFIPVSRDEMRKRMTDGRGDIA